jgi:hypothetical protein
MSLFQRIRGLDGDVGMTARPDERPEAFLRRVFQGRRTPGSRLVGEVLVQALDRIAVLEAEVERLKRQGNE